MEPLDIARFATNPIAQFRKWFEEAQALPMPEAMTLATVDRDGRPRARMVLLKRIEEYGFFFFSNYQSAKADQLASHPHASLVFWWLPMRRQVRIDGSCVLADPAISDAYFSSRPRNSQLGAWSSPQSRVIPNRDYLATHYRRLDQEYDTQDIPRPPHWGGYLVRPDRVEFWQEQPYRLHDRIEYTQNEEGSWTRHRLAP